MALGYRFKIEGGKFKPETATAKTARKIFGPVQLGVIPADMEVYLDAADHR